MRVEIKKLQQTLGITSIYVTHDQVEAMTLGHRLMVLNEGNVEQLGTPIEVYDRPASTFVAGFIGSPAMNFLDCKLVDGGAALEVPGGERIGLSAPLNGGDRPVTAGFRPEHFETTSEDQAAVHLTVSLVEQLGADTLVHGSFGHSDTDLTLRLSGSRDFATGETIPLKIAADNIHIFEPATGTSCRMIRAFALSISLLSAGIAMAEDPTFDAQGHRGARGLSPENTLVAFERALSIGVHTLELDTGLSADGVVVVSHDPRLNPAITRDGTGKWLPQKGPALVDLTFEQIQRYDVGAIDPDSRYRQRFPDADAVDGTRIPSLQQVFELVRREGTDHVRFNIETKIVPNGGTTYPAVDRFVNALLDTIDQADMGARVTVQSFDWRSLQLVQRLAPNIPTVYLTAQQRWLDNIQAGEPGPSPWIAGFDVDEAGGSVPDLVKRAGGAVWSPYFRDLADEDIRRAHDLGLKVVVWTVNDPKDMNDLIDRGVDGIITDYPDRLRAVMKRRGMTLPTSSN